MVGQLEVNRVKKLSPSQPEIEQIVRMKSLLDMTGYKYFLRSRGAVRNLHSIVMVIHNLRYAILAQIQPPFSLCNAQKNTLPTACIKL